MSITIAQGFDRLKENLLITDIQEDAISARQRRIREAVANEMDVVDTFLTGSYRRHTMIAPLSQSDIDIFIALDYKYYSDNGQAYLLDKLKDVLKKAQPTTREISRDGQAVTISFSDFKVDVVPAFQRRTGFIFQHTTDGFIIPNTITKKWIETNPQRHIEIWSKENKKHNGSLIPFIKMIKAWNKVNGGLLSSFHLECLIFQIMRSWSITDYPSAIRYLFQEARRDVRYSISDPALYGSNVGEYLRKNGKMNEAAGQLELAYERARNAEKWIKKNIIEDAYYYYGKIFGDYYPSYG